jgi:hypothetical protein
MPTARELLEQADALMRRNRKRGRGPGEEAATLTDALGIDTSASLVPTLVLPDAPGSANPIVLDALSTSSASSEVVVQNEPMPLDTLGEVPVLTDVVLDWPGSERALQGDAPAAPAIVDVATQAMRAMDAAVGDAFPASAAEAQALAAGLAPPAALEREGPPATHDAAIGTDATAAPKPIAVVALGEDFILEIPPLSEEAVLDSAAPETPSESPLDLLVPLAPPVALPAERPEPDALAEEIRMQVLQRLDLFTDTGLREQLAARLAPIVDRASAQLIETINRELGELVRGYVAEAIEREIETWRKRG